MFNIKLYLSINCFDAEYRLVQKLICSFRLTEDVCENESYDTGYKMYQKTFCSLYIFALQTNNYYFHSLSESLEPQWYSTLLFPLTLWSLLKMVLRPSCMNSTTKRHFINFKHNHEVASFFFRLHQILIYKAIQEFLTFVYHLPLVS